MYLTFADAVDRLQDYLGAGQSDVVLRDCKQASIEALRELVSAYTWTYLYKHGRIVTDAAYTDGTIDYAAVGTDASYEVTLTGGTWPSWAATGTLRVGDVNYEVSLRLSGTTITLLPPVPSSDFSGQEYGLYHDTYSLPDDFLMTDLTFRSDNFGGLEFVHPREWLWNTAARGIIGDPRCFTITADPDKPQGLAVRLAPFPDAQQVIEYLYKRKANELRVYKETSGTISTTADSTTTTGTGTAFSSLMPNNAVLRISGVSTKLPTAQFGDNPAVFESKITSVTDASTLTTWDAPSASYSNVKYTISSYVDIETGAMEQAYLRACEMIIGMTRTLKDKPSARAQYNVALDVAKSADSRNMMPRTAGISGRAMRRLRDYPIDLSREV